MSGFSAVVLKSSCDACTASKVKCSGGEICHRCESKGIGCFYSPRKKRGPVKKKDKGPDLLHVSALSNTSAKANNAHATLNSLALHERRSWSVFFTLYKHYHTSCSRFWFSRQLRKMRDYLRKKGRSEPLKRLESWMDALNIDMDDIEEQMTKCMLSMTTKAVERARNMAIAKGTGPSLYIKGELKELQESDQSELQDLVAQTMGDNDLATLKIRVDDTQKDVAQVDASPLFESLFGYSSAEIVQQLGNAGGGFLPWGGDVMSPLLTSEKDLLAFVQIMAIKFNNLDRPEVLPIAREVPSSHIFPMINQRGALPPVQCLIRCVHRETIGVDGTIMEMFFTFQPMSKPSRSIAAAPNSVPVNAKLKRKLESLLPNFSAVPVPPSHGDHVAKQRRQELPVIEEIVGDAQAASYPPTDVDLNILPATRAPAPAPAPVPVSSTPVKAESDSFSLSGDQQYSTSLDFNFPEMDQLESTEPFLLKATPSISSNPSNYPIQTTHSNPPPQPILSSQHSASDVMSSTDSVSVSMEDRYDTDGNESAYRGVLNMGGDESNTDLDSGMGAPPEIDEQWLDSLLDWVQEDIPVM